MSPMPPVGLVLNVSWAAFMTVWLVGTFYTKPDVMHGSRRFSRLRPGVQRFAFSLGLVVLALGVFARNRRAELHPVVLFWPSQVLGWAAVVLTIAGIGFAIWARFQLGRNWSARPSRKHQHELVKSGPYRLVRHPIYTGMLTAIVGLTLTGNIVGPLALALAGTIFVRRTVREEQIMLDIFPDQYAAYRQRTARLIPFVW